MARKRGGGGRIDHQLSPPPTGSMPEPPLSGRVFNNADSFAQAFDEAWHEHTRLDPDHGLEREAKMALLLETLSEHPFCRSSPDQAAAVAAFRVRLLGL
jgi:hypothetical protein